MMGLWQDVRYGTRMLAKDWRLTTVATLSLALGIGANAVIFSFANALLLRPLPVFEPERLVAVTTSHKGGDLYGATSLPDYKDLRDRNEVFSGLAAHSYFPMALTGGGRPEVGLFIAAWAADLCQAFNPPSFFPIEFELRLDQRVVGFTLGLSLLSTLLFGLAPAIRAARSGRLAALTHHAPALGQSRRTRRFQRLLVAAQVALCLVSLISAGLLLRSLNNTLAVDPGFDPRNGLIVPINLGYGQYDEARGRQFYQRVVGRVASLGGVRSATLAAYLPLGETQGSHWVSIEGYRRRQGELMQLKRNMVGPRYFETMGIPILRGRGITEWDTERTKPVAVVNETMARRYWAGRDPLGGRIRMGETTLEVVGVMKDGRYGRLDGPPEPYFCLPIRQDAFEKRFFLVVRTVGDPRSMVGRVLEEIRRLNPDLPAPNVMTMKQFLAYSLVDAKAMATLVGIFGLVALVLAMVGVYGVMAFSVSQRAPELGLRMALGAQRVGILKLVLAEGMTVALVGVGVGLVMAFGVTRVLSAALFRVSPVDPFVFGGVSLALGGIAALACYVPARSATNVDPISVLRNE